MDAPGLFGRKLQDKDDDPDHRQQSDNEFPRKILSGRDWFRFAQTGYLVWAKTEFCPRGTIFVEEPPSLPAGITFKASDL
jgi:hypothetical protein